MSQQQGESKPALTKRRILTEAVVFADEQNLDALSMRKLAERLGAGTMSLYNHVANKDEMIEGMVDVICAEIDHPSGTDWRKAMQESAASAHEVLLAHKWAAGEWTRRRPGPVRVRYMEAILRTLTEAGLDDSLVYHGYHAITMHIVGFTIQELGYLDAPNMGIDRIDDKFLDGLRSEGLPHLATHAEAHIADRASAERGSGLHETGEHGHDDEFGFVLNLILDGLDRSNKH